MIELYIENKKIELETELEVDFTYETIDPQKLSSIKNSFSKTVNIPGTPNNNITFGHIFRNDKYIPISSIGAPIDSFYDPHKKVSWIINKNGSLVQRGYCTLDGIDVNDDRKITYKITLYGGIGEFFYSLSYNEDGSAKTLKDVFYDWRPKRTFLGYGQAMNTAEEMTDTLMVCSSDIISQSYHNLNPNYTYSGTTDIDKDVVFIPCYSGLYDDFDSKHMLVSVFNQNYTGSPMSSTTKQILNNTFKDSIVDDGVTYTTLDKEFSSTGAYRYGLATFSRDLDPSEAGDLRINELPAAIRLSKLLWAITRPENCGEYEVEWSQTILNSLHFLYGWVLLGKLKTTNDSIEQVFFNNLVVNNTTITYNQNNQGQNSTCTGSSNEIYNSSVQSGKYNFKLVVKPKLSFEAGYNYWNSSLETPWMSGAAYIKVTGGGSQNPSVNVQLWTRYNIYVVIHKFITDSQIQAVIADAFFYSSDYDYYFGRDLFHSVDEYTEVLKSMLEQYIQNDIDKVTIHNCIPRITDAQGSYPLATIYTQSENEQIRFVYEHIGTNLRIDQECVLAFIQWGRQTTPIVGLWGLDDPYNSGCPKNLSFFGLTEGAGTSNYVTNWYYNDDSDVYTFSYDFISGGLYLTESAGFNILELDKQTLFASSDSPFKYLVDYCKMMNYKFICDNISKKINILAPNEYYEDTEISLEGKVDYSRTINVNPVIAKNKIIDIGLNSLNTYPIELIERKLDYKYGIKKFDTNIEYSAPNTTLLDNLIYKSTSDWQLNSIFYHLYPQLPKAYNTPTLSWTLFNYTDGELDKKEFIITAGEISVATSLETLDKMPKLALFDKSQKYTQGTTFIFLNGFVKNYDYAEVTSGGDYSILQPTQIKTNTYVNYQAPDSEYTNSQYILNYYDIDQSLIYYVSANTASNMSNIYVINYYASTGNPSYPLAWIGSEYQSNGNSLSRQMLHIPSNATMMKCNFLASDRSASIETVSGAQYAISPRLMFSTDTAEQYYLNEGKRCYMYDFKYNDVFVSWGCYSTDQKGVATSWVLPFFTRDLYNKYIYRQDTQQYEWRNYTYKLASWNIVDQDGLDSIYSLSNTTFLKNQLFNYSKTSSSANWASNEYEIDSITIVPDSKGDTIRPYDSMWEPQLKDIYDRNSREVTLYVDLSQMSDSNNILRQTYIWEGQKWIITKIHNFRLSNFMKDKFTKVTMKKVADISAWIN